jgi:hypothetical protein
LPLRTVCGIDNTKLVSPIGHRLLERTRQPGSFGEAEVGCAASMPLLAIFGVFGMSWRFRTNEGEHLTTHRIDVP